MILVISILIAAAGCYSVFIGYLILVSKTQLKLPSRLDYADGFLDFGKI